ncbi:MAG: hypothetical protein V3S83_12320 [Gemmatimonadota bacterium]
MILVEASKFPERRRTALAKQLFTGEAWQIIPLILAEIFEDATEVISDPTRTDEYAAALVRLQVVGEFRRTIRATALTAGVDHDPFPQVLLNSP